MRVAMVDPSLFTLPYDAALAGALTELGCRVTLHARRLMPAERADDGVDLSAHFYPVAESRLARKLPAPVRLAVKAVDHAFSMRRLLHHIRHAPPDVVHFQWLPLPLLDGRLLHRFRRVAPLVLTVHDTDPFNGSPASVLQRLGVQHAMSGFSRLIVHTTQGLARLRALGIPAERICIVPHGHRRRGGHAADAMQGELTFLLFGKIKSYKGADVLIDAFAALPAALRAQARLRIVGKPYMDIGPLRAQAAQSGAADRITIEPSFVSVDAIATLLGPGTIMVFPYREIEASGVLFQALEYGRPVLASRLGAFADMLVDGEHGRLVPPGESGALSAAMAALIADRALAAANAAAISRLAARIPDWRDVAGSTIDVYRSVGAAA
jgi:glycosyltransferase involved in cell wall biosynthesis